MKTEKVWEEKCPTQEALNNDVPDHVCLHFSEQKNRKLEITVDVLRYDISKLEEKINSYKEYVKVLQNALKNKKETDKEIKQLLDTALAAKKGDKIMERLLKTVSLLKNRNSYLEENYMEFLLHKTEETLKEYE